MAQPPTSLNQSPAVIFASTDSNSPKKLTAKFRRSISLKKSDEPLKRTISVEEQEKHVLSIAEPLLVSDESPRFLKPEKEIHVSRIENIRCLRKIHYCLMMLIEQPEKKLILKNNSLVAFPKDYPIIEEMNTALVQFICHRILRAMRLQTFYFLDNRGHFVSLKEIWAITQQKYGKNVASLKSELNSQHDDYNLKDELSEYYKGKSLTYFGNIVADEFEFKKNIRTLTFPKHFNIKKMKENSGVYGAIFQRLYSVKKIESHENEPIPILPPMTVLYFISTFSTKKELLEEALVSLLSPNEMMPYIQKLRTLSFIRCLLDSHYYQNQEMAEDIYETIDLILLVGSDFQHVQKFLRIFLENCQVDMSDVELKFQNLLKRMPCFFKNRLDPKEITKENIQIIIDEILFMALDFQKPEFIDLCYEIKFLLLQEVDLVTSAKISPSSCVEVKKMLLLPKNHAYQELISAIADDLKYLSAKTVVSVSVIDLCSEKAIDKAGSYCNRVTNYIVTYFINIFEAELLSTTDPKTIKLKLELFSERFTDILNELLKRHDYLSSFAVYTALSQWQIKRLMTLEPIKSTSSKSKRSSSHKPLNSENKKSEYDQLFSFQNTFENLRKIMKNCQHSNLYFVPLLNPIKSQFIHFIEKINFPKGNENIPEIDFLRLHLISKEVWKANKMLQHVREHFKSQMITRSTDIDSLLLLSEIYDEVKLEELHNRLKHVLTDKK